MDKIALTVINPGFLGSFHRSVVTCVRFLGVKSQLKPREVDDVGQEVERQRSHTS